MPIPQPGSPRLWGNNASEIEEARGVDRIRLTWDEIAGADGYELRVDGGVGSPAAPDVEPIGFGPNSLHKFEVRAHDANGWSMWSAPFETVTRPLTPLAPVRNAVEATLWGVTLQWTINSHFPGGEAAYVEIWRRLHGVETAISSGHTPQDEWLDETDPGMAEKEYWLRLVVPAANVPGNILGGDNASFFGGELQARGPIVYRAILPVAQIRPSEMRLRSFYRGGPSA